MGLGLGVCDLGPQGIKTRALKVVPLKVLLSMLRVCPLYYLNDLPPKPEATTLRVQGTTP